MVLCSLRVQTSLLVAATYQRNVGTNMTAHLPLLSALLGSCLLPCCLVLFTWTGGVIPQYILRLICDSEMLTRELGDLASLTLLICAAMGGFTGLDIASACSNVSSSSLDLAQPFVAQVGECALVITITSRFENFGPMFCTRCWFFPDYLSG